MNGKKMKNVICMIAVASLSTAALFLPFCSPAKILAQSLEKQDYREHYYYNYIKQYGDEKYASQMIDVDIASPVLNNGSAIRINYNDRPKVLQMPEGSDAAYRIDIPEDALYEIDVEYMREDVLSQEIEISITLDGESIFTEAGSITLSRIFRDKTAIMQDSNGNDLIPKQEEVFNWQKSSLTDNSGWSSSALRFFIPKGTHEFTITNNGSPVFFSRIQLVQPLDINQADSLIPLTRSGATDPAEGVLLKYQAEITSFKSSQMIFPVYDRTGPATEPYHVSKIRRNTIGQDNWNRAGMWISYVIRDIPADGYYDFTIKYRQSYQIGMSTYRNIYVNGVIPGSEFYQVVFPYDLKWHNKTIADKSNVPVSVYLKKGENEIKFQVTTGPTSAILQEVDDINFILNEMYLKIIMVTGTITDTYRDYKLDKEIPDMIETFQLQSIRLRGAAQTYNEISGEDSTKAETLLRAAEQLDSFVKDPDTIPQRLASFQDTKSGLADWLYDSLNQPLEFDYFLIHSADQSIPDAEASLLQKLKHFFGTFIASFTEDYNSFGEAAEGTRSINVWVNTGRDQIQIVKDMTMDQFTPETGVNVNLSLVQSGLVEATLAGTGPDVAIGIARGQPVNLACRGILTDLSKLDGFDSVMQRFSKTAGIPYQFDEGTYALPNTQTFYMMFYRKDILDMLGMEPPDTWTKLLKMLPRLQKNHMSVGLPYSVVSAATIVDNGMGSKDLFPILLLQNGGSIYNKTNSRTDFNNETAMNAFKQWCDFYVKYGFDLAYDLYSRFRTGEMPIAIASYEMYNNLSAGAPEIRNQWAMAPIPGTLSGDTIDRSVGGAGTAVIMLKTDAETTINAWKYMKWWTEEETQYQFGMQVENILGAAGRYTTANIQAFERLPWNDETLNLLRYQREYVKEIPEIPGSYIVSRSLDNAFRAVLFDGENAREAFENENRTINREIERKRIELGLE